MAYERKFEQVDLATTELHLKYFANDADKAWDMALAHVDMGLVVTPILVHKPQWNDDNTATATYDSERIEHGAYVTESGRDGQYYMVMIDRHKNNEWMALTPCSDYYAAVEPTKIYASLRSMLAASEHHPTYVYNAYNGGSQLLKIRVDDLANVDLEGVDGIHMEITLKTSLDKSSNHVLSVMPVDNEGTPIMFSDTGSSGFTFKVRHTTGARAEIVNFNAAVAGIANAWNKKIVPYVRFLSDGDLSETDTLALLQNVIDDAALPKDIGTEILSAYKAKAGGAMAAIKIIGEVVTTRDVTPMAEQRDTAKVTKAITARVKQLFEKRQRSAEKVVQFAQR